jgi:hypothetical protein
MWFGLCARGASGDMGIGNISPFTDEYTAKNQTVFTKTDEIWLENSSFLLRITAKTPARTTPKAFAHLHFNPLAFYNKSKNSARRFWENGSKRLRPSIRRLYRPT